LRQFLCLKSADISIGSTCLRSACFRFLRLLALPFCLAFFLARFACIVCLFLLGGAELA
jgi:hypothetical protein